MAKWWFKREDLTPPGSDTKYLTRWTLWRGKDGRALYLHHITGSDWAREPHDHPKDFVSIGLWGGYIEQVYGQYDLHAFGIAESVWMYFNRIWRAPWFRKFSAEHIHRLVVPEGGSVWTLVYVGPRKQDWGFYDKWGERTLYKGYLEKFDG